MNRNLCYPALILKSRPSGESNRDVWLLSAEAGLLRATVFGGPKSKLRAYASPFHSGQAHIYRDPAKDSRKLSDFDVKSWRPGLRELYERMMAADAAAETVLETHGGGGNWGGALALAEAALDALAAADSETCSRILVHFLWQWAGFLGIRPEFDICAQCGKPFDAGSALFFSPQEGGMVCFACCSYGQKAGLVEVSPGCRRWLETVNPLAPDQINRYTLDGTSFRQVKLLTTSILAETLGKRLSSWEY